MARRTLTDPTAVVARRGGALFIDAVLCGLAAAVPLLLLADPYELNRDSDGFDVETHGSDIAFFVRDTVVVLRKTELAITVAALGIAALLILVVLPGRRGWSPGHLAADLRIVRRDGSRAGIGKAFLRTLGWIVDILPGIPIFGYVTARRTRRHQRVGDLLARTYVVDKRADGRPVDERLDDDSPATMEADVEADEEQPVFDEDSWPEHGAEGEDEPMTEPNSVPDAEPQPEPAAAAAVAAPPEGVPPDQPIWDRRNKRYVLWHSKAGRWLTHTESGWAPFEQAGATDATPQE